MDPATLAAVRGGMGGLRPAESHNLVGNDECCYSFDSPYLATGLFVNLKTFNGVGRHFLLKDAEKTGAKLYAHHAWRKKPKATPEASDTIGVGVEGGFALEEDKFELVKTRGLAVICEGRVEIVPLTEELPEFATTLVNAALDHLGSKDLASERAWALTDEPLVNSKYAADLEQVKGDEKTLSPDAATWKCGLTGETENLWLNLSTGYIGGGRDQSAWGGPKGSNGALRHYEDTGKKYPLVVKLGTINGVTGTAEVYSYASDEDGPVLDPKLNEHLRFWGINALAMEKTEKTTAELEVDANVKFEWNAIAEEGNQLTRRSGAGLIGLANLGNSCYMNSVCQLLASVEQIGQRYSGAASLSLFSTEAPAADVLAQFAKLVDALRSDRYQLPAAALAVDYVATDEETATLMAASVVAPRTLKNIVGKGHVEFATPRQQDAAEYLAHLLETLKRAEHLGVQTGRLQGESTSHLFTFNVEDRTECCESKLPRYAETPQLMLDVPLPRSVIEAERSADSDAESKVKRTRLEKPKSVTLDSCLAQWASEESIDEFFSSATGKRGKAVRRTRLITCPRYLVVKLNRYYVSSSWEAKKVDVLVEMPLTLDLSALKSPQRNPEEATLPEEEKQAAPAEEEVVPDEMIVAQLISMGFHENGCRRACLATQNAGSEQAMEWVFAHMADPDFTDPLTKSSASSTEADPASLAQLASLGFEGAPAEAALKACDGDCERAADWIFSHLDDLEGAAAAVLANAEPAASPTEPLDDGEPQYELAGFVSHIGKNTGCGHYVAHIAQPDGTFVIFNDEKVATSENPPLSLGYLYLYKRKN